MRDDIIISLTEEQAGLIMLMMSRIDWCSEPVGHVAEAIFTELADQDVHPAPLHIIVGKQVAGL